MATAAVDTTPMIISPGLDAIRNSPLSSSTESLHLGDYLDLGAPSSSSSPPLAPATSSRITRSSSNLPANAAPSSSSSLPDTTTGTNKATAGTSVMSSNSISEATAPPPPGSSPEAVFRYYLKIELRKMGSPADDSIIDKYVQQHYGTFIKAMETGKHVPSSASATATPASSSTPRPVTQKSGKGSTMVTAKAKVSSAHYDHDNISVAPLTSMPPHTEPEPFKVPLANHTDAVSMFDMSSSNKQPLYDSIDPHYVQFGGTSASHLTGIKRERDAMSDDGGEAMDDFEEDSKDDLAPLISEMHFGANSGRSSHGSSRHGFDESDAGSSRGSEEPVGGGVPPSIRDSVAADLRPTAEEYRALSSKEKRQLRNKISARNFRERRKEYITHLESKISSRDSIIDSLRQQLSAASLQNKKLEEEVKTLQAKTLSQTDVQKILEALQNVTSTASAAAYPTGVGAEQQYQQPSSHLQHQGALRSSAANDLTLASAGGALGSSSRPSTPSSPRPHLVRRGSPSIGSTTQLPQHNPRKDIAPSSKGTSTSGSSGFWKGGPTVAASA